MDPAAAPWPRLEAALDTLLDLPPAARDAAIARLADGDAALEAQLRALALGLGEAPSRLDRPAAQAWAPPPPSAEGSLGPGALLGPWRLTGWLGAGGMGEVWRAERADGQFEQRVAIKLVRVDARAQRERFQQERQIVARLEHPGIARLLDGGVAADGRPYMVMELVEGEPVVAWCARAGAGLAQRLRIFDAVCDAVAWAHRHLVVHRDLKPANVLVTDDGRPKLLDFGVARLLDGPAGDATREVLLTPGYAAPEQLAGGAVTTATDVHALGLLLHELLTGRPAHEVAGLPLAAALQHLAQHQAPAPSRVARQTEHPPVAPALLAGDLDAIVAKATRPEPEQRYDSVDALRADLRRWQAHEPVLARRGSWAYVSGRALRRHRVAAAAAAAVLLAVSGGAGIAAWQAHLARQEAVRATAIKEFLLRVFKASDPRVASDVPRDQITARALLEAGTRRVDDEFAGHPELQLELLGTLAAIWRELGQPERFAELQARRLALAQRLGGHAGVEAEIWLARAGDALDRGALPQAREALARTDRLLHQAGLDRSALRAQWWTTQGQATAAEALDTREAAFDQAIALFERHAPHHAGLVTALTEKGVTRYQRFDLAGSVQWYRRALAAYETAVDRDDGEAQTIWGNLATSLLNLGQYDDAEAAYRAAAELARRTYGESHPDYWVPAAHHARLLHLNGRRDYAMSRLDALRRTMPWPPRHTDGWEALAAYIDCMVAQGQGGQVVEQAEALERAYAAQPHAANSLRRTRLRLGEIYDQLGRAADARRLIGQAYAEYRAQEAPGLQPRLAASERWARLLLDQGQVDEAAPLFDEVVAADGQRHLAHAALARAGQARVALARGDTEAADRLSQQALEDWRGVRGFRDVRMGAYIGRVRAQALLARGDLDGARRRAEEALQDSLRFDAPQAASIAEARALLQAASGH